jgi:uncharacterized membrane protein (UPF0127 family)
MGNVLVRSLKNQAVIADKCFVAERFLDRLKGLIGRAELPPGEAMLFPRCNSVHMWFMRIPIDVVFAKASTRADGTRILTVSSAREHVRAWRPHPLMDWKASDTLELPAGTISRHSIRPGDELCIS